MIEDFPELLDLRVLLNPDVLVRGLLAHREDVSRHIVAGLLQALAEELDGDRLDVLQAVTERAERGLTKAKADEDGEAWANATRVLELLVEATPVSPWLALRPGLETDGPFTDHMATMDVADVVALSASYRAGYMVDRAGGDLDRPSLADECEASNRLDGQMP